MLVGAAFELPSDGIGKASQSSRPTVASDRILAWTELEPEKPGDIKYSYADISLAKNILGYQPKVSLRDGLQEIIDSKRK